MKQFELEIAEAAEVDLDEILDYIAFVLNNVSAACKLMEQLKKAFESLKTMPERQALVSDSYLAARGLRMLPVANYTVFYTVNVQKCKVTVVRVLYRRRAWDKILR